MAEDDNRNSSKRQATSINDKPRKSTRIAVASGPPRYLIDEIKKFRAEEREALATEEEDDLAHIPQEHLGSAHPCVSRGLEPMSDFELEQEAEDEAKRCMPLLASYKNSSLNDCLVMDRASQEAPCVKGVLCECAQH